MLTTAIENYGISDLNEIIGKFALCSSFIKLYESVSNHLTLLYITQYFTKMIIHSLTTFLVSSPESANLILSRPSLSHSLSPLVGLLLHAVRPFLNMTARTYRYCMILSYITLPFQYFQGTRVDI